MAITTDIIVGFPGEAEAEYQETRDIVERVGFDNAFVFRYSKRRATPAAEMEDALQVPERVKEERNQDLLALVNQIALPRYDGHVGRNRSRSSARGIPSVTRNRLMGRTSQNRIVVFEGDFHRHTGQLFHVQIEESQHFTLYGNAQVLA